MTSSDRTTQDAFERFVETIAALRAPDGCPWDRAQTHQTIAKNLAEEAYEAIDAIEAGDIPHLREELGDVLLQVVLQSQIAADDGEFTITDVIEGVNEKIIRRHPHVFGERVVADDPRAVLDIWDQVKLEERQMSDADGQGDAGEEPRSLLTDVPTSLPALMQAQKVSRKMVSAGFEWSSTEDVWEQVRSEVDEFNEAVGGPEAEEEFGDILFSLVNVARREGIDAESALRASIGKVRARWSFMERQAASHGVKLEELSTEEQEELWQEAKAFGL